MDHYTDFDAYVTDHPEGEYLRNWLVGHRRSVKQPIAPRPLMILKGNDHWTCQLPGGYYRASYHGNCIVIGDGDDGMIVREFADVHHMLDFWTNVLPLMTPIDPKGLIEAYGFKHD